MQTNPSTIPTKKIKKFGIFRFHSIHKYDVTLNKDNIFLLLLLINFLVYPRIARQTPYPTCITDAELCCHLPLFLPQKDRFMHLLLKQETNYCRKTKRRSATHACKDFVIYVHSGHAWITFTINGFHSCFCFLASLFLQCYHFLVSTHQGSTYRSVTAGYRQNLPIPLLGGNTYRR